MGEVAEVDELLSFIKIDALLSIHFLCVIDGNV